jgi:GTP-binding protein LepA
MSKLVIEEPLVLLKITSLSQYLNNLIKLLLSKRCVDYTVLDSESNKGVVGVEGIIIEAEMPLNEILYDFNDKTQSITKGNVQLSYVFLKYRPSSLVKLEFKLNGNLISDLSMLTHSNNAYRLATRLCSVIKDNTKRQLFKIIIQGLSNNKIIIRDTINPFKKDVTSKCYGGDISRKKKLLSKQKKGKARLVSNNYNKEDVTLSKKLYKKIFD